MQKVNFSWEVIIADDCSSDNTRQIIFEYKNKYPDLIKLLFQDKNVGGGKNFVDLLNSANGKYIAYLEGDDYWTDKNKLQKQFDFMQANPSYSMCYHKIKWEFMYESVQWSKLEEPNCNDPKESTIYDLLEKGWFIRSCSMFFINFKLPEGFEKLYIGDYPLHVLLADLGNIGFIDEFMGTYRIHQQGLSETMLISDDLNKKIRNHKQEIFLCNYLNSKTNFKYQKEFKKKIFDEIYSFNKFLLSKNLIFFLKNIWHTFFSFNTGFLLKQSLKKISKGDN